jgi:predicted Zn-dependent peptidase
MNWPRTIVRILSSVFITLILLPSFASAGLAQTALKLPPHQKVKLPNGLTIILMEQREVPIVSFNVLIRAGAVADPKGREGLSSVTAEMIRKGTKTRTAEKLAAELDFVGGELEFSTGADFVSGSAEVLKKDLLIGLDILSDVLQNPTFPPAEVTKLLRQRLDEIKQQKDEPGAVIGNYYDAFLFGNHLYGRPESGDEKSLTAITRADVVRFYQSNYSPQTTTIAVVGDFDAAQMQQMLSRKFGAWNRRGLPATVSLDAPVPFIGKKLLLIDKADTVQTYFQIGNIGVAHSSPDRVGIGVVNTVFGARFTSLLNSALRINSGLTYGARSGFALRRVPGSFVISSYTQTETTVKALDTTLEILDKLHTQGLSEEQLQSAKAYVKGQFAPDIETTDQLAAMLTQLDFYSLGASEINDYFAKIDALTVNDASRIIRQYFPRENLVFVLIGRAERIREEVKKYAPQITAKKITDRGF